MDHSSKYPIDGVSEICLKGKQTQEQAPVLKSVPEDKKARLLDYFRLYHQMYVAK